MGHLVRLKNQQGFTIVSAILATVIIIASLALYTFSQNGTVKKQDEFRQTQLAKSYAVELLEMFRSFENAADLMSHYLGLVEAGHPTAYPLCSQVNVYNRNNNTTSQPDSVADMAGSLLDNDPTTPTLNAHRSYQMQFIDATTLEILNVPACALPPDATTANNSPAQALLAITVTVTWIPKGGTIANEKKVEVSTVLPVMGRTTGVPPPELTS